MLLGNDVLISTRKRRMTIGTSVTTIGTSVTTREGAIVTTITTATTKVARVVDVGKGFGIGEVFMSHAAPILDAAEPLAVYLRYLLLGLPLGSYGIIPDPFSVSMAVLASVILRVVITINPCLTAAAVTIESISVLALSHSTLEVGTRQELIQEIFVSITADSPSSPTAHTVTSILA